jgi:hypothetical protein
VIGFLPFAGWRLVFMNDLVLATAKGISLVKVEEVNKTQCVVVMHGNAAK